MKYQSRSTTSGCNDIAIRKSGFVVRTQFLCTKVINWLEVGPLEMCTEVGVCQPGLPIFCNRSIKHCVPFNSSSLGRVGFLIVQNIDKLFFLRDILPERDYYPLRLLIQYVH